MKIRSVVPSFELVAAGVLALVLSLASPVQSQTVLIDFGNSSSFRGASVVNPDGKGHYWNSVWSGAFYPGLVSTNGTATSWAFGFEGTVPNSVGDTDSYNGPAGDTSAGGAANVTNVVIDSNALGDLGITNAVFDYYVNSRFQIQGLTPGTSYTLTFFGSHKYSASDITVYSIFTNTTYTMLETSVTLAVQSGTPVLSFHNSNTVVTVGGVKCANDGIMYVQFNGTNTVNGNIGPGQVGGYLNCLKITSGTGGGGGGPCTNVGPAVAKTVLIDFGATGDFRSTNTPSPDVNGHYWNSVTSAIFNSPLKNAAGANTALALGFDVDGGHDSYNGPAGDTSAGIAATIGNCVFDPCALGYLGVTNAVYDYYVSSKFQLQGLDPAKQYSLTFFGSQKFSDSTTRYSVYSDAGYSTLITSVTLNVNSGGGNAHNQNQTAVIGSISPPGSGILYIQFAGVTTPAQGYLNCMQVVDISGNTNAPPSVDPTKEVLIDMGNNADYRSVSTPSPDVNGHYWNSVSSSYFNTPLTNAAGAVTSYALGFDIENGHDSYNGPAGDTSIPGGNLTGCVFNATALGDLGVTNAVYDYYVQAAFQIQGVSPSKTFRLTFFGSQKYSADSNTVYSIYSDAYSTLITSVVLNVGSGNNHNQDRLATVGPISSSSGIFYIKFQGQTTPVSGFLNCLSLVDLSTNVVSTGPDTNKTVLLDFGDNRTYRGTNTVSPDRLGHYWNNIGCSNCDLTAITLTNAAGAVTAMSFVFNSTNNTGFGTDSYNGPAGPTDQLGGRQGGNLNACVFNETALGYLGITNAVYDFYVNPQMKVQGMDPAKSYQVTFFGSHKFNTDNTTLYQFCSDATYSTILTQTSLLVGVGSAHNQDQVATITTTPRPDGTMYIKVIGSGGNFGYLNCMQIVDASTNTAPPDLYSSGWRPYYFPGGGPSSLGTADPDGDGLSNTNEFLAGFNPNDSAAYPHIINIAKAANPANLVITYLGASGDISWSPGFSSRTNVLEFTAGTGNGFSNNFASTGQTNILSGGIGGGTVASFIETNAATGTQRFYRVRVLVP